MVKLLFRVSSLILMSLLLDHTKLGLFITAVLGIIWACLLVWTLDYIAECAVKSNRKY